MTFIASLFVMYCKESGFKNFEIGAAVLKTTLQFLFYFMFAMRFLEFLLRCRKCNNTFEVEKHLKCLSRKIGIFCNQFTGMSSWRNIRQIELPTLIIQFLFY